MKLTLEREGTSPSLSLLMVLVVDMVVSGLLDVPTRPPIDGRELVIGLWAFNCSVRHHLE